MIMRIFQVTAKDGKEEEFGDFFQNTAISLMRERMGLYRSYPVRPAQTVPTSLVL